MRKLIEQANILVESLPYIKDFYGKVIVIKYGGSAMSLSSLKEKAIEDIVLMKLVGMKPVVIHGGGPAISRMLGKIGKETTFINGLRVTDEETMEIAEMVLSGQINKEIVSLFQQHKIDAVGISGKDGMTLTARKRSEGEENLGFVGEIASVNTHLITVLLDNGFIPVIAPVSCDSSGVTYNINADYAASALSTELKAEKLIFLTDTPGVLKNPDDPGSLISLLNPESILELIEQKAISGGMIPKVQCAADAVRNGVHSVHILDGKIEHALLLEVFTRKGIGTLITKEKI